MTFADSNIFIYAADDSNLEKHEMALDLVAMMLNGGDYLISSQVLNEFSNVALKKLKKTDEEVKQFLTILKNVKTVALKPEWTIRALKIRHLYGTQFYDSLLLATAEANKCKVFLSEDLSDGQVYCGMTVVNPFTLPDNKLSF